MASLQTVTIHWFRRDLRLEDNAALFHALQQHTNVLPVFIFDKNILDDLEDRTDARITYIHACLKKLNRQLETHGSSVLVFYDKPLDAWKKILSQFHVDAVYANHDYEPYARERDAAVKQLFAEKNIPLHTFKDQVIFEKGEVVKDDGTPYTVFTPYSKKWKAALDASPLKVYPTEKYFQNFKKTGTNTGKKIPSLQEIGFQPSAITIPPSAIDEKLIIGYDKTRDFPAVPGTSRLSVHLRFGTISIRHLVKKAIQLNEKYWNELIWREFYQMILWHFPHVVNSSFRKEYDNISWRNHEKEFQLWCEGKTGYPIVDAGMRELNTTGYMHNRVRMIVASFLTKHLLIDWRWGEAYFAKKLLDFELASNNGGWQWAAGTGVDAAPYFRIFNPYEQTRKFDPELIYIKKWVPEYAELSYPQPVVDHAFARQRCLQVYKAALQDK